MKTRREKYAAVRFHCHGGDGEQYVDGVFGRGKRGKDLFPDFSQGRGGSSAEAEKFVERLKIFELVPHPALRVGKRFDFARHGMPS